jgi:hypothetical protein
MNYPDHLKLCDTSSTPSFSTYFTEQTLRPLILVAPTARLVANHLKLKTFFSAGLSAVILSSYMAVSVILSVK